MNSAIRARREAEDGFTLIELLVVVIIIGILAAIAIPAFLNQRERAWQAELTSAVRNAALDVEAEATAAGGVYPAAAPATFADFQYDVDGDGTADTPLSYEPKEASDAAGAPGGVVGDDFCVIGSDARINDGDNHISYQSSLNGLQDFTQTAVTVASTDCTLDDQ